MSVALGPVVERSTTGANGTGWKLGGRSRTSWDPLDPNGRKAEPCQGEGSGFESRLPLRRSRSRCCFSTLAFRVGSPGHESIVAPCPGPGRPRNCSANASDHRRRRKGSGGVVEVADDTWKVDIELPRDAVTGRRRRVARTIRGTREEAELAPRALACGGSRNATAFG